VTHFLPAPLLGVSVETAEQARRAARCGAAYLGVTVWATATKSGATPVGLNGLRAVCAATSLPVIGIGGIDAGNAAQVLAAGARGVAVVSAVGAAGDMVAATRALAAALGRSRDTGAAG
jgi:thiamine-phosphate pyrophosphorylase